MVGGGGTFQVLMLSPNLPKPKFPMLGGGGGHQLLIQSPNQLKFYPKFPMSMGEGEGEREGLQWGGV